MDIERFKKLSGQSKPMIEAWKEVKFDTSTEASQNKSRKKAKENNKDTSNKSAKDVRTTDASADIANDVAAELTDVNDTSITMKDGEMDAGGEKAAYKTDGKKPTDGEMLNYTISINDAGAPVVDNNTVLTPIPTHSIGDLGFSAEGVEFDEDDFLLESDDTATNVYMIFESGGELLEDMAAELKQKIETEGPVQISVLYKNDNFTGHIHDVGHNQLSITPSKPTKERYNIRRKDINLPLNVNALKWSTDHPNRVVGKAEPVEHEITADNTATDSDLKKMGVQTSSFKNSGAPLTETVRNLRTKGK